MYKKTAIAWLSVVIAAAALCSVQAMIQKPFEHYKVIIDRKPFGDRKVPEPPVAPTQPVTQENPDFARSLRLCSMIEDENGDIIVGLVNSESKKNSLLRKGYPNEEGFELIEAFYDAGEIVLRQGSQTATLQFPPLNQPKAPPAAKKRSTRVSRSSNSSSYAERRRKRSEELAKLREARRNDPNRLRGEELKEHLREYQKEVIRSGLPPLPIPLSPEDDAELVAEGVLPPQ